MDFIIAPRRGDEVPTRQLSGRFSILVTLLVVINASLGSSLSRTPNKSNPSLIILSISFVECAAISILSSSNAWSISFVNNPLPSYGPIDDPTRSPDDLILIISMSFAEHIFLVIILLAKISACLTARFVPLSQSLRFFWILNLTLNQN